MFFLLRSLRRFLRTTALAIALCGFSAAGQASDIDTEHMFGLTEGSDFGAKGELELEYALSSRFGRLGGRYSVFSGSVSAKYSITDDFRIAPGLSIARHDMSRVPGLPNRGAFAVEGGELEFKYRLLRRDSAGVGLTIGSVSGFSPIDAVTGRRSNEFGTSIFARFDRELIPNMMLAAFNVDYGAGVGRAPGFGATGWDRASSLSLSSGVTMRAVGRVFIGAEARYVRASDGIFLNRFAGHAVFAGPNLFYKPTDHSFISLAWNRQMFGRANTQRGRFDLDNFERNEVRIVYGTAF